MADTHKTLVVDIDGTLCPVKEPHEDYADLQPYADMVEGLRRWKNEGGRIILHTARNMRTYQGNLGLINTHTAPVLLTWLKKWGVPYDEIVFGKPWVSENGFYVDDRAIRPQEFLTKSEDELNRLVTDGRPTRKTS